MLNPLGPRSVSDSTPPPVAITRELDAAPLASRQTLLWSMPSRLMGTGSAAVGTAITTGAVMAEPAKELFVQMAGVAVILLGTTLLTTRHKKSEGMAMIANALVCLGTALWLNTPWGVASATMVLAGAALTLSPLGDAS